MRFLIVAASILACAAAVPSASILSAPLAYSAPVVAPVARLAPALPTISAGNINGAAIEAHVEASDHARASYDAARQLNDKVSELHGQAINAAEENGWRAIDDVKTAEAQLDGAAAGSAPIVAKQIVRSAAPVIAAPVAYAAPVVAPAAYAAPAVYSAPAAYAAAAFYGTPAVYGASAVYGAPAAYAAPVAFSTPYNYAHW